MSTETASPSLPRGLPRPEIHFVRARGVLEEINERDLLSILIGNLVETDEGEAWIGEVRCSSVPSPDHPGRKRVRTSTRAVRIPLQDGCVPEAVSERAVAAFMGRAAILDTFGPHEAWVPTAQERRVIDAAVTRRFSNLVWFLSVAGRNLFAGDDENDGADQP